MSNMADDAVVSGKNLGDMCDSLGRKISNIIDNIVDYFN